MGAVCARVLKRAPTALDRTGQAQLHVPLLPRFLSIGASCQRERGG